MKENNQEKPDNKNFVQVGWLFKNNNTYPKFFAIEDHFNLASAMMAAKESSRQNISSTPVYVKET